MSYTGDAHLASPPSSISSPRGTTFSSHSTANGSVTSLTSYASSFDGVNDSPRPLGEHHRPTSHPRPSYPVYACPPYPAADPHRTMNATQYAAHPHHGGYMDNHQAHMTNGALPSSMPQPHYYGAAPMPPPMHGYAQQPSAYGYYGHPVSHAQHYPPHPHSTLPAPPMLPPSQPAPSAAASRIMDTTGQIAPPNHKPKLTGTVWEDEGTICFQVEVSGICVARREDNHFINGTKLLNVANMTRGRRDGILKSEKHRNVIKIGPMHLKGVWIPFQRALEFANKEKITEQLYPLFVNDIGPLLTPHMQDNLRQARASNGRPVTGGQGPSSSQPPPTPAGNPSSGAPSNASQSLVPISTARSDAADRPQGFPTPPTSTSSAVGANGTNSSYDWGSSAVGVAPSSQAPAGRSVPSTPTSAAPEHGGMPQYPSQYDSARGMYPAPSGTSHYGTAYGAYMAPKTEMPAPTRAGEREEEPPHYAAHDHAGYTYNNAADSTDHKSSPQHTSSGRATPRSLTTPQTQWPANSYNTPQRAQQALPSSSLTYGSSAQSNGYAAPTPQSAYGYSSAPASAGQKRGRDDDDDPYARPVNGAEYGKRQKLLHEDSHARPAIVQRQ